MKALSRMSLYVFIAISFLVSCTKSDVTHSDSISLRASDESLLSGEFSTCKLRRIVHRFGGDPNSHYVNGLFTYNAAGNPISLLYNNVGTGNPNHYFIYDSKNRLTEWRKMYGNFIVAHHFFKHNANNQIVYDSLIMREAGAYDVTVSAIEYDSLGRVVRETIRNTFNDAGYLRPTRRPTYTYDNRGNLGVLGWKSSSYDNKVSIFRAHPVFQFIFRNYSRNNAVQQPAYNSKGLPLSLVPANDAFFNAPPSYPPYSNTGGIYKAIYDCD